MIQVDLFDAMTARDIARAEFKRCVWRPISGFDIVGVSIEVRFAGVAELELALAIDVVSVAIYLWWQLSIISLIVPVV